VQEGPLINVERYFYLSAKSRTTVFGTFQAFHVHAQTNYSLCASLISFEGLCSMVHPADHCVQDDLFKVLSPLPFLVQKPVKSRRQRSVADLLAARAQRLQRPERRKKQHLLQTQLSC
jgi:hypothetical protein